MKKIILLGAMITLIIASVSFWTMRPSKQVQSQQYYESAQKYYSEEQYRYALLQMKQALKLDDTLFHGDYFQGLIYKKQRNWSAMYASMLRATKRDAKHVEAIIALGQLYFWSGDNIRARAKVDIAKALTPKNVAMLILSSHIYTQQGDGEHALVEIKQAVTIEPLNMEAIVLYTSIALALAKDKNYPVLEKMIVAAKEAQTNTRRNYDLLLIQIYIAQKKHQQVIQIFNQLIAKEPNNYKLYEQFAIYYYQLGDLQESKQILQIAIDNNKENISIRLMQIFVLSKDNIDDAITKLKSIIKLKQYPLENINQFKLTLGALYEKKKQYLVAQKIYQAILSNENNGEKQLSILNDLARISIILKEYDKTKQWLDIIQNKNPNDLNAYMNKALLALEHSDDKSAITNLKKILRLRSKDENALQLLVSIYLKKGDVPLARSHLRKLLRINALNLEAAKHYAHLLFKEDKFIDVIRVLKPFESMGKLEQKEFALLLQARLSVGDWEAAQNQSVYNEAGAPYNREYTQALILKNKGKYEQSNEILHTLLQISPPLTEPLLLLINNYNLQRKYPAALSYLLNLTKHSENIYASRVLARQYALLGQRKKAIDLYQVIIKKQKTVLKYYHELAILYQLEKNPKAAIDTYLNALQQKAAPSAKLAIHMKLAELYDGLRQYSQAITHHYAIYEANPLSKAAANNVAYILSLSPTPENLAKAERIGQSFKQTRNPDYADTLGWIYFLKKEYVPAKKLLQFATQERPHNAIINYHLGQLYYETGQLKEAETAIGKAITLADNGIYFGQYNSAFKLRNQCLEQILERDPANVQALNDLIKNYTVLKEEQKIITILDKFLTLHPQQNHAYSLFANFYLEQKKVNKAVAIYLQAIQNAPKHSQHYQNLAAIYRQQNEISTLIALYEKALIQIPEKVSFHYVLAEFYQQKGNDKKALLQYLWLLNKNPISKPAVEQMTNLLNRVSYLEELNQFAEAFNFDFFPELADSLGFYFYLHEQYDIAIQLGLKALAVKQEAITFYHLARAYEGKKAYLQAQKYYHKSIQWAKKYGKFEGLEQAIDSLQGIEMQAL